jgi:hypothetical protein
VGKLSKMKKKKPSARWGENKVLKKKKKKKLGGKELGRWWKKIKLQKKKLKLRLRKG